MEIGWKAAKESRRPHASQELSKNRPSARISKRRRQSVKDSNRAMALRGHSAQGLTEEAKRREEEREAKKRHFIKHG